MEPILIPIFAISFVFGSIMYVAYVVLEIIRSRQQARLTSEFNHKLLDKVSSAQELTALLNSHEGAKLLASLQKPTGAASPQTRILRAVQAGVVLLMLGVGLLTFAFWTPLPGEVFYPGMFFATAAVSLGVGLLLSAAASYGLSRRMGILATPPDDAHKAGRSASA